MAMLVVNSLYASPRSGRCALELFTGNPYANIYSPFILFETESEKEMSKLVQDRVRLMRALVRVMRDSYGAYLCVASNPHTTANSLRLEKGMKVFYKMFRHPQLIDGISSLLPKFAAGTIHDVLSKTSVMVRSDLTGRLINRHVSDVHPAQINNRFVSKITGAEGFKRLANDVSGSLGAHGELPDEESQIRAAEDNREVLMETEKQIRLEAKPDDQPDDERRAFEPRRSRRLQGEKPDPDFAEGL